MIIKKIKNKNITLCSVLAEDGNEYWVDLKMLIKNKELNGASIFMNYLKNKIKNFIKVGRYGTK